MEVSLEFWHKGFNNLDWCTHLQNFHIRKEVNLKIASAHHIFTKKTASNTLPNSRQKALVTWSWINRLGHPAFSQSLSQNIFIK